MAPYVKVKVKRSFIILFRIMNSKIFLIGFMGSGKTHWGKIWAKKNELTFFDLDEEIENTVNESVAHIFDSKGEEYFRESERDHLRGFETKNNFILACGGGTACFFDNLQWMKEQGSTIYMKLSPVEIFDRVIMEPDKRPLIKKTDTSELLLFIEQKLIEREAFYYQAKHILNANALNEDSLTKVLFEDKSQNGST
jgi:shikimate kinase